MNEALKALNSLDNGIRGVFFIIDEQKGCAIIDGDRNLKEILFEVSSHLIKRFKDVIENANDMEEKKPEGAKWFLPYLPPGGIEGMTFEQVCLYWSRTMRTVCSDRGRNMGYASMR